MDHVAEGSRPLLANGYSTVGADQIRPGDRRRSGVPLATQPSEYS